MHENYCPPEGGGFFRGRSRMGRGDMSPIVLNALTQKPMHGYEIMRQLEEDSHGMWRPSAGSIYPTLQLLEEQELVTSHEENGKKVYTISEAGREYVKSHPYHTNSDSWKVHLSRGKRFAGASTTIREFAHQMREIATHGTDQDVEDAKNILKDAVTKLADITSRYRSKN